jgi:lipoprotein-anchoring transpeptidase ErfK/SrfK
MSDRGLRPLAATAALILAGFALTACDSNDVPGASALTGDSSESPSAAAAAAVHVTTNVKRGASDVPVDTELSVTADGGTITAVRATSAAGALPGEISADGAAWKATGRLEPGTSYVVKMTATNEDGQQVRRTTRFATQDLSLDQQTYPSVAPLADETVGVGMPVIVTFDLPVTDRAAFEKHMTVTATPAQKGAWHWLSATEAHWRPKTYWKAGSDVHVDVDVNSVPAGDGIYGQESRELDFHVGEAHVYKVNAQTHQMKVLSNGKLLRTIPITTGKPGFTTRSGIKVIIEKFDTKRMNSETVGIPAGSADAYDIDDVKWAMRLTYSGEFIHGAPWSVGSQGYANVSHGCTGMSDANAQWLYAMSRRGDVVEYTGTDRQMTFDNGYGDWNESFAKFKQGSALS